MRKKILISAVLLVIGFSLLITVILVELPDTLKWALLAVAILLNVSVGAVAMRAGIKEMRPEKRQVIDHTKNQR